MGISGLCGKHPVVVKNNFEISKLPRVLLASHTFEEDWLQRLLEHSPNLVPASEFDNVFAPLICIGRETSTKVGPIDLLMISPQGYITIVETKLWRNPEARRMVIAQILDYAKEVCRWSYTELDAKVRKYLEKKNIKGVGLFEYLVSLGCLENEDEAQFKDATEINMQNARFLLMIVGDGIHENVMNLTSFLNSNPNMQFTVGLLELEVYRLADEEMLVVPNLLMRTQNIERGIIRIEGTSAKNAQIDMTGYTEIKQPFISDIVYQKESTPIRSMDDYLQELQKNDPEIDINALRTLLSDLNDLGYNLTFPKYCLIQLKYPGMKRPLTVFDFVLTDFFYQEPRVIENALRALNYSLEISKTLWNKMYEFCDTKTQERFDKTDDKNFNAGGQISTLIKNKDRFLEIMEEFISNFQ